MKPTSASLRFDIGIVLSLAVILIAFTAACSLKAAGQTPTAQAKKQVIAYIFAQDRVLQPGSIAAGELTRINYAFANIQDGQMVEGFLHDGENYAVLRALKQINSQLQVLASVGGWTWSKQFSDVALTPQSRRKFVDSAAAFIERHHLDGLDVDWEYPGLRGDGNPFRAEDRENFTALLRALHLRFQHEEVRLHRRLLLTIAAGSGQEFLDHTEMKQVARYLDTVNLMTYDMYGDDRNTGHHAPLYAHPDDPKHVSSDAAVRRFLASGVPRSKLVLGVPFYGKGWREVGATANGLFQPGTPAQDLHLDYAQIMGTLLQQGSGYVRYWDASADSPYLYNAATRAWVDYEDSESLAHKALYVRDNNLAGIMFWEYSGDSNHTLTHAIYDGLHASTR